MTATDTEAALLAAIRANPGEDAPRLVYADWLEENAETAACAACKGEGKIGVGNNGNPYMATCDECHGTGRVSDGRAEWAGFVRVQVELAKWNPRDCNQGTCRTGGRDRPCTACREREELQAREHELWPAVRRAFAEECLRVIDQTANLADNINDGRGERAYPTLLIQRGLPAVVRCAITEWMGGECAACVGTGWTQASEPTSVMMPRCSQCHGKGEIPGIGPRLAQRWPIERVEASDKTAWRSSSPHFWSWWNENHSNGAVDLDRLAVLPPSIFFKLTDWGSLNSNMYREYDSEPAARAALSDALIEWARGQSV